jgi:hypothetical protein
MATNTQGTRQSNRPGDPTAVEQTPTPVVTQTGVGSVAVYDQDTDNDHTTSSTMSNRPSATLADDRAPMETRSSGSSMSWIIGAIVLIILAYFLLQIIF